MTAWTVVVYQSFCFPQLYAECTAVHINKHYNDIVIHYDIVITFMMSLKHHDTSLTTIVSVPTAVLYAGVYCYQPTQLHTTLQ